MEAFPSTGLRARELSASLPGTLGFEAAQVWRKEKLYQDREELVLEEGL